MDLFVHKSMAYRPVNSISEMINKNYIVNCPIDRSLLLKAEQIFGRPYQKVKSKSRKKHTIVLCLKWISNGQDYMRNYSQFLIYVISKVE